MHTHRGVLIGCSTLQAVDENGARWLRLPALAKWRTADSIRRSSKLAARFGGYTRDAQGKNTYHEVASSMKMCPEDKQYMQKECTAILLDDGIIKHDAQSETQLVDTHGNEWWWPEYKTTSINWPGALWSLC